MRIAVTLGDPAGIGPEVALAAISALAPDQQRQLLVFGDEAPLRRAAETLGVAVPTLALHGQGLGDAAVPGQPDERAGRASVAYLEDAVAALRDGRAAGLVTAPISKTWARRAGFAFPGHTELLAERLGAAPVAMMFAGARLHVALATVHVPLAEVSARLSAARVRDVTGLLAASLRRDFGVARPRLGVVGLNPHAGEGGLLGREELEVIAPAIEEARAAHGAACTIEGPLVPDAAFRDAAGGTFDGLVAMYHDQALIPVKLLDFEDAVNVTLGLPVVRTSPDHGTAYDLAGRGRARARSMQRALQLAFEMVARRAG
ncbi:MAG: 4-hydroxythreonine-4-phosphate dehydrogenase PdxA [Kofleriaceae bacterium]